MKKYRVRILGTVGALIAIVSVLWEYARMRPDYQFVVEPWSLRGYEIVHGWVSLSIGVAALLAFWLVAAKFSEHAGASAAIVGFIVIEATIIAAVFGPKETSITPGFVMIVMLTILMGLTIFRLFRTYVAAVARSFLLRSVTAIVCTVASFIVVGLVFGGGATFTLPLWSWVLMGFVLLAALALSGDPKELSANRMLIYSSLAGGIIISVSAGATRSTLVRYQAELDGIFADYKDTQVTWGHLMGVIGLSLVFLTAVALWARRRDLLLNAKRARRQREAAEASAAEITAAQERVKQRA